MSINDKMTSAAEHAQHHPETNIPFTCAEIADVMRYIRNLEDHKAAHEEFSRKTDWVQKDKRFCIPGRLGMHRADVMMMIIADHAYDLAHQLEITHRLADESNRLFDERAELQQANAALTTERDDLADRCRTLENAHKLTSSVNDVLNNRAAAADALLAYVKEDLKYLLVALYSGKPEETIKRGRQIQHRMGWLEDGE